MRSLWLKLTLGFLLVGLTGAALVAIFAGRFTQREFDRFVISQTQLALVERAADHYEQNGSFTGLVQALDRGRSGGRSAQILRQEGVVLVDGDGRILAGPGEGSRLETPPDIPGVPVLPIEVDGEAVGWFLIPGARVGPTGDRSDIESNFLRVVNRSILLSAVGASVLALLLGLALAGTITRPVREMTQATEAIASGELGLQVPVRTEDELGQLAVSLNQMSADLARSSQLRQQMTADIAHDLRTPLSVILGYTEALSDGKLTGRPETYQAMHTQAKQLNRLIEDLRTLSLADAGQLALEPVEVAPCELLEQVKRAYEQQAFAEGLTLTVECASGLPPVRVDLDRFGQVLGNLVSNAIHHTPAGGHIELSAALNGDRVRLSVRDTGPGITPEEQSRIFDRFYRGDAARQADGSSGLGLAIARSIVEAHKGVLSVDSPSGQGASFHIDLPPVG